MILPVSALPTTGDNFEYTIIRKVGSGIGEYNGYTDELKSNGKYEITYAGSIEVQFHAAYSWTYHNSEGLTQEGSEYRTTGFSPDTRRYTTKTDLDEYDKSLPSRLSVWLWISPDVRLGDKVSILDDEFTVTGESVTIWSGWLPVKGIELRSTGTRSRDDEYGIFTYNYTDIYYFDRSTGYILAERYTEKDTGYWKGAPAEFQLTERFDLSGSSFSLPVDYPMLITEIIVAVVLLILISYDVFKYTWRAKSFKIDPYGVVTISRITSPGDLRFTKNLATKIFDPFIHDLVNKTLLSKNILSRDIVCMATSTTDLLGIATYNRESDIGMILCENTEVKEGLRRFIQYLRKNVKKLIQ